MKIALLSCCLIAASAQTSPPQEFFVAKFDSVNALPVIAVNPTYFYGFTRGPDLYVGASKMKLRLTPGSEVRISPRPSPRLIRVIDNDGKVQDLEYSAHYAVN